MNRTIAIVLAAGKGTRMKSELPKVLFPVRGRPMVEYVLDALVQAGVDESLVVVGYRADLVRQALSNRQGVRFVDQTEQLGTGHAVQMCVPYLQGHEGAVLVVTGDSPMTQASSLTALLNFYRTDCPACVMGTLIKDDPTGLGRIVRDEDQNFLGIVEHKDASPEQLEIREVNMSTYVFDCQQLLNSLGQITNRNQQGEYYITDCPGLLKQQGAEVRALPVLQPCEALSINDIDDLEVVEAEMQRLNLVT